MEAEDDRAKTLTTDDLVAFVGEAAAERQWAPAALAWDRPVEVEADEDTDTDTDSEGEAPQPDAGGVDLSEVSIAA